MHTEKVKMQKVILKAKGLSRDHARRIQKAINARLAGKKVNLDAVLPDGKAEAKPDLKVVPIKPESNKKLRVELTYREDNSNYRTYYADGTEVGVVRESNSQPGMFRYKVFDHFEMPFHKEKGFKSFKAANGAALKYFGKYLSFKKATKAENDYFYDED